MKTLLIISIFGIFLLQTGCASFNKRLKALLGSESAAPAQVSRPEPMKYSQSSNLPPTVRRKYKRMTRETFEKEALLGERQGSLWVMEGQGAYLFSQNIMRMVGDPLAVALEGDPKEQLQAKVDVIHDLLQKIEDRQKARLRGPASASPDAAAQGAADEGAAPKPAATAAKEPVEKSKDGGFNVKTVPTRIIERTADGNYRVKGDQPFLIKGREYKVIVTGVVRAEDFNDEGIGASKLLDPKFDIVSVKRAAEGSTL